MTITLTVADRIATISTDEKIVAGNTYPVTLSLDSEWTGTYYVRVRFGSLYYDIPASGSSVNVQIPVGYPEVGLGIYSENIGICTNEVRVKVLRSILEQGVSVVEFDTDLYTQWQNEVSELVCDSDFDAESERPVKNSVLTAWKNTVPLDSALVHKTGNETIDGVKSFVAHVGVYKNFNHFSDTDYESGGIFKCQEVYYDKKNGSDSMMAHKFFYRGTVSGVAFNSEATRLYKPDRSGYLGYEFRAYPDHITASIDPYYPVDSGGNPQPIGANALITSGNIAVDPRIIHTTGAETVAGNKTFTATMNIKGTAQLVPRTVYDAGTPSTFYGWKGRISIVDQKDGVESTIGDILCTSMQTYGEVSMRAYKPDRSAFSELRLRDYADFQSLLIPSHYPVDGSGNPTAPAEGEAMSSGMVAVDPRIVRTTGNQTVAGVKTLTNGINAYPAGWHTISKSMTVGQYCVFASINPANLGPGHFHIADFVQSSNTSNCYGRLMFKADRTSPLPMWIYRKNVGSNSPLDVGNIVVLTDASTVYLAWKKTATYGTLVSREVMDINYGGPQSLGGASNIQYYAQADMTILDSLDGYTVYEVTE